MASDLVRHIDTIADDFGVPVAFGVDHAAVTIGPYQLGPEVRDDFARLFFKADEQAKANAEAMRRQLAEETLERAEAAAEPHECSFPCNPPGGTFWAPGPCVTCGKPYAVAQAERQLAEAQAALAEAHGQVSANG